MITTVATLTAARAWAGIGADDLRWSQLPPLPDPVGVAGAFAGVSDGKLFVAGGANFPDKMPWQGGQKIWLDTVYALDQTNSHWRVVGKLPRPLAYGVSLTTKHGVLCIGGSDAMRHYADTFLLTETNGKIVIRSLPSLPVPLANAAGALVGQVAYVAGGAETPGEQAALNRVFALDLAASKPEWRELPPCPGEARILAAAGATADAFYLLGGAALRLQGDQVKRVYLRDAWKYLPAAGKWERLADLPWPSVAAPSPAPIVDSTLLLLGGDDGSLTGFQPPERHPGFPRVAQALDLRSGTWLQWDGLPMARATLPATEWRGLFVLPSGEVRPGVRSPEVWTVRWAAPR
jgi:N-acetylneuraminic acid mutarotase